MSNVYQKEAYKFAAYGGNVEYPFLALGEEVGEVLGKLAKFVRKNDVSVQDAIGQVYLDWNDELRADLIAELGDVMWQLAACCTELGIPLEEVQETNIAKLQDRKDRGTIVGEGDKR